MARVRDPGRGDRRLRRDPDATDEEYGIGESGRADTVVRDNFPEQEGESVLVQSRAKGVGPGDPAFKAVVADLSTRLESAKGVRNVESPYAKGNDAQISKDGRSVLVNFDLPGDDEDAEKLVDAPLAAVSATERSHEGFRVEEFGGASAGKALSDAFEDDFQKAEVTSLPVTLIILAIAFGTLVAAGLPLLLALTAVAATLGLIGPISQISPVSESINLGDPADRTGRRGRLLPVLHPARARGTSRRARARRRRSRQPRPPPDARC